MNAAGEPGGAPAGGGPARWLSALPDAAAFAGGLAIAWLLGWNVRDLVWSLWLSSLLVGYAIIVWRIFGPAITDFMRSGAAVPGLGGPAILAAVRIFGGLFMLAFFTVHFGMFHFVHSVFLNQFFPAVAGRGFPAASVYLHVLREYWPFVLVAALAERDAFRLRPAVGWGGGFGEAYKNVLRMHLLIFFFVFAHFAKLENILVYAIVYAVYFFPWRLVRRGGSTAPGGAPVREVGR